MANANYANRGKSLEQLIDFQNQLYRIQGLAVVHKIPTLHKTIVKAGRSHSFYAAPSIVDYVGLCNSEALAFDAKMTATKNLPLANIPEHQIKFLVDWQNQGGTSFLLVEFTKFKEIYRLPLYLLQQALHEAKDGGRKSIPLDLFRSSAVRVQQSKLFPLDYLGVAET